MTLHFIRITATTLLLLACMFLPFMPGDYDDMAITLSSMVQLGSIAGLLLVPVGFVWLLYELIRRKKVNQPTPAHTTYYFGITALVISCVIAIAVSLGAFINEHRFIGYGIMIFWGYIFFKTIRKLRQLKNKPHAPFKPVPVYLISIPMMVVLVRLTLLAPAVEYSRKCGIKQSERLIGDIEMYKDKNGHYPASLLSVWEDYKPSVTGIKRYHYELSGTAYNIYFEQFAYELNVKEIVMYNKLDEHAMNSHNQDRLQFAPENIIGGYFAVHDLPSPHWKYFWFD